MRMHHPGEAALRHPTAPARGRPAPRLEERSVTPGSARIAPGELTAALWRLLAVGHRDDAAGFLGLLDDTADAIAETSEPVWIAWRHALAARRSLLENDPEAVPEQVTAAREALDKCDPSGDTALAMAYLAHVEVTADHFDAAMLLAVDASLLAEGPAAAAPSKGLLEAHRWLSLTLAGLDLEELAVAHALRGQHVAAALREPQDQWRMRLLSAQQHVELSQTLHRRGDLVRSRDLAIEAIAGATAARDLPWEPEPAEEDLLDVVQGWAMKCSDDLDGALGPLRRVRRHVQGYGDVWLRGYTDLALARVLAQLAERDDDR